MGAGFSRFGCESIGDPSSSGPSLGDVPENCISAIFMYLDPPEICRLASLSRTFHGASLADLVWESKLPSNYEFLIMKVLQESPHLVSTKKQIYARLCQPTCFDGGNKQFWVDKNSGKLCLSMSYKALRITGIDDRRYWSQISSDESRFQFIAYLQQIWWFQVVGELDFEFPPETYSLFFRLQLGKPTKRFGRRVCNVDQVHGWSIKPVQFQLSASNGQLASSECHLRDQGHWVYYKVGNFAVDKLNTHIKLKFSMTQIDCTHTKGGVCLDSVLICPSKLAEKVE